MSSRVLDYFVLEAADYVERLDGLLASAGPQGPDADAFVRQTRALRGSATMARLSTFAELAAGVERIARAVRDRQLPWDAALRGVLVASIDDLKILVRGVRTWGNAEEQRARARLAEVSRWAPAGRTPAPTPSVGVATGSAFLVGETAEIAAALEAFLARPADRMLLGQALGRVRALRGLAGVRDVPPLADVMDGVERAAKPMELGGAMSPEQREVIVSAAAVLRRATAELRAGGRPDPAAPEIRRFADASARAEDALADADRIVPVSALFHDDAGPHVVHEAPNPPTSPAERFRLEVVSQAEHLRRLVADGRTASESVARERLGRELRGALRALRRAAESFGERAVAGFIAAYGDAAVSLDALALTALDEAAVLLANPATRADELARRLDELGRGRATDEAIGAGLSGAAPVTAPAPAAAAPVRAPARTPGAPVATTAPRPTTVSPTPTGRELHSLLQTSLDGLGRLRTEPLSEPLAVEDAVVPIESLLYAGDAALARAREVRDELRRRGGAPDRELLDELFELLDLATAW